MVAKYTLKPLIVANEKTTAMIPKLHSRVDRCVHFSGPIFVYEIH